MKKQLRCLLFLSLLFLFCLSGCRKDTVMETVGDHWDVPAMATPREIRVNLPEDAAAAVLEGDTGCVYLGENYEIILETLDSGDLDGTLRKLCGKGKEALTVVEREQEGCKRYEFVWAAAGETGEQLGRCAVLDDGSYHYCMTVLYPAEGTQNVSWQEVFQSFTLSP